MGATRQKLFVTLRAAAAALLFLLAATAAPLALAAHPSELCAMTCCVEQGHCCCNPRSGSAEELARDGQARLAEAEIYAPCPEDCATGTASSSLQLRHIESSAPLSPELRRCIITHSPHGVVSRNHIASSLSAPRAPPALSYFSA